MAVATEAPVESLAEAFLVAALRTLDSEAGTVEEPAPVASSHDSEINFVEISFEFREIYDSRKGARKANIARKFRLNLKSIQYVMF